MDLLTLDRNSFHIFFLGRSCRLKPSEAFSSRYVRKEHGLVQSPMDLCCGNGMRPQRAAANLLVRSN